LCVDPAALRCRSLAGSEVRLAVLADTVG
jgi:hypothetical protein